MTYYHGDSAAAEDRWLLCRACLVAVSEMRIGPDGAERGWIGQSLREARREAWREVLRESSELAARTHGSVQYPVQVCRVPATCWTCFGTIERGDRYGSIAAGAGTKWNSWKLCWNCFPDRRAGQERVPLPRETWRDEEDRLISADGYEASRVQTFTESGEEIPF